MEGTSALSARVKTSHSTPARASAADSSRTYTFIPPPSPDPGCASGEVCIERTASLRTRAATLLRDWFFLLRRHLWLGLGLLRRQRGRHGPILVLVAEREVDAHDRLLLVLGEERIAEDL